MADAKNNKTGALGPDGYDDITGKPVVQAPTGIPTFGAVDNGQVATEPDPAILAAVQAAVGGAQGALGSQSKTTDTAEFQVNTGLTPMQKAMGASDQGSQGPYNTIHYGLDTTLSNGFMGLTDQRLIDAVVTASNGKVELFDSVYKKAVATAAALQKSGKGITVMDVLSNGSKYKLNTGTGSGYGPFTNTSRSINLTNPSAARQLLNHTLAGYLGREATQAEQSQFLQALNALERQNPSTTVTKGTTSKGGTTSSSQTKGGFDSASFAEDFAKSQEGYAEYQASTTFLDAFIGALENKTRVI